MPHNQGGVELFFSNNFGIDRSILDDYGAFDVSLVADLPLFVDPFLLFSSNRPEYRNLHDEIIEYLRFLRSKAESGALELALQRSLYSFKEVKQNWLGFTRAGNTGAGLGAKFARSLHNNLHTIFADFGNEKITRASHLEKLSLLDVGVGRDRISDFTTRLILNYLCEYTQAFARAHLTPAQRRIFAVERAAFDYELEVWITKRFELPAFRDDYVLLTPANLLTKDDTWISRKGLLKDFTAIPESIPNDALRAQVNGYFLRQLPQEPSKDDIAQAIEHTVREFPIILDYYIRYKEEHEADAVASSREKVRYSERIFQGQAAGLANLLAVQTNFYQSPGNTYDECLERLAYLKHVIEDRGGYRTFYSEGLPIERESDLHVMFDLVWHGSPSDVNREVNNGRGPADFTVSRGSQDKTIVEFKLARNSQLKKNLKKQTEVYERSSRAQRNIKVVLFMSAAEELRVRALLKELGLEAAENVILIDARPDNKPSGSKA